MSSASAPPPLPHIPQVAGCIAATAGTALASVALYGTLVQQPAGLEAGTKVYTRYFGSMIKRGAPFQGTLSVLSAVAAGVQAADERLTDNTRVLWAAAAAVFAGIGPYSLLIMHPTTNAIVAASEKPEGDAGEATFVKWGNLAAVRTAVSIAGVAVMCYALARKS